MIDEERIEWNFAETAYWWLHRRGYGSEAGAIRAVRKRKGMGHLSEATVTRRFLLAVAILRRTEELAESELQRAGYAHLFELSQDEFDHGTSSIAAALQREFPRSKRTVEYMVAMLWDMPYVR